MIYNIPIFITSFFYEYILDAILDSLIPSILKNMSSWFKTKLQGIREWYSSQDTQQGISVITGLASDAFKVIMASMLAVFIPQACTIEESNTSIYESNFGTIPPELAGHFNGSQTTTHICTFHENFSDLMDYNAFVLAFNFLTLGYFIYLYKVEITRERWMIDNLDYDKEKPDDAILAVKDTHSELIKQLQTHNIKYMRTYKYIHVIYLMNFAFSAVLVLYYYYLDYRTATTLITNTILVSNKIRIGRELAIQSYKKGFAYSFYNNKNISFNTIDARYLAGDEDKMFIETDVDNPDNTIIGITGKQSGQNNKKCENLHKHISNIRKYINKF